MLPAWNLVAYTTLTAAMAKNRARRLRRMSRMSGGMLLLRALTGYANVVDSEPGIGKAMNHLLWTGRTRRDLGYPAALLLKRIAQMDAALHVEPALTPPLTLYRGVDGRDLTGWRTGSERVFPAFLSTSFMPVQALLYAGMCTHPTVLVLRVDPATACAYLPKEDEVVLERGTRWRLVRRLVRLTPRPSAYVHPRYGDQSEGVSASVVDVLECVCVRV